MGLILDTSVIIDVEKNKTSTIERLFELFKQDKNIANISFITYFEIYYGYLDESLKQKVKNLERLNDLYCLVAGKETSKILAEFRHKYKEKGINFSMSDLIIAAQTYEHNLILVTKGLGFKNIDEIKTIIIR